MTPAPKGYVALTSSRDGSAFLLDARGLSVSRASGATIGANKLPTNCNVGCASDTDSYWTVAESFDEVCAKLAAALGEQGAAPESDAVQRAFAARVLKDIAKVGHVVAQEYLLTRADELCAGSAPKPTAADLTATERAVVEAAHNWFMDNPTEGEATMALSAAVQADLAAVRAARGGA